MKQTAKERTIEIRKETVNPSSQMRVEHLMPVLPGCRLFANVELDPGISLDYHEHHNERELYYILEGEGIYRDNEEEYSVSPGDVVICFSGSGHAIKNEGAVPLRFIALILQELSSEIS